MSEIVPRVLIACLCFCVGGFIGNLLSRKRKGDYYQLITQRDCEFEDHFKDRPRIELGCGALLIRLDYHCAQRLSFGRYECDFYIFGEGDVVIVCGDDCPCSNECALRKKFLDARTDLDVEAVFGPLVDKGNVKRSKRYLSRVDYAKPTRPGEWTAFSHVKALVVGNDGRYRVIIPPMLAQFNGSYTCTYTGRKGTDCGQADKGHL